VGGHAATRGVAVFRSICVCVALHRIAGAVKKPLSDRNYNSPQALMYRAYNGQL